MKNHYLISPLILTKLVLLPTGCQKEKLDYPELVDGATFNQFIPELATSVVFEYNDSYKGNCILSTPRSSVPIYGRYDGTVWHVITSASTIYANPRCDKMFYNRSKLTSIDFGSGFNTSNVVSMTRVVDTSYSGVPSIRVRFGMFAGCSNLTSLDLSGLNTSNVTDMRGLFENCSKLTSLDVTSFNTSNVVSMGTVYRYFYNSGSAGQYGRTVYLTNGGMFENCTSLTNLDLSNFNTTNVARMYNMFENCTHMTYLNLSNFDMSNLEVTVYDQVWHFTGKGDMCWNLSVSSGNCTIVCTESVQNSLLYGTSIPVDQVVFTWVRP